MNLDGLNISSIILGALATGCVGGIFKIFSYLYSKRDLAEEQTFEKILSRLDRIDEKTADFREEWGAFKKELQMISASAMVVKQASEEIIIIRRNLDTAFKRIDEIRSTGEDTNDSVHKLGVDVRATFKGLISKINDLKKTAESLGGKFDKTIWIVDSTDVTGKN